MESGNTMSNEDREELLVAQAEDRAEIRTQGVTKPRSAPTEN